MELNYYFFFQFLLPFFSLVFLFFVCCTKNHVNDKLTSFLGFQKNDLKLFFYPLGTILLFIFFFPFCEYNFITFLYVVFIPFSAVHLLFVYSTGFFENSPFWGVLKAGMEPVSLKKREKLVLRMGFLFIGLFFFFVGYVLLTFQVYTFYTSLLFLIGVLCLGIYSAIEFYLELVFFDNAAIEKKSLEKGYSFFKKPTSPRNSRKVHTAAAAMAAGKR